MESTAKIRLNMPAATFGQVLDEVRQGNMLNDDVQRVLRALEVLRHHHLGHGMADPFNLTANEVDFVYVTCAVVRPPVGVMSCEVHRRFRATSPRLSAAPRPPRRYCRTNDIIALNFNEQ
jgi:hypothetical protein